MPELPDLTVYAEALAERVVGATLDRVELASPFLLRTARPPLDATFARRVERVFRQGKRLVVALDGGLFVAIHLMIAGRLRWLEGSAKPPSRITLAVLHFSTGRLAVTEAGTKRRAALHVVDDAGLHTLDAGGLEVQQASAAEFAERLRCENHTLKRALADPRLFAGIGNAYSDEILHRARLSPLAHTRTLDTGAAERLRLAACDVLDEWSRRLRLRAHGQFPGAVTAFQPEMAVHGKFGQPCPVCGAPVQRIVYAENECNYCARCQTAGVIHADRALSRLLHASWPRSLDALE